MLDCRHTLRGMSMQRTVSLLAIIAAAIATPVLGQPGDHRDFSGVWRHPTLPGFEPFPFYPGYSADFFDDKHYVAKGGSPLTAAPMLRRSFRNWFQPHYPYVYAGFRCVAR